MSVATDHGTEEELYFTERTCSHAKAKVLLQPTQTSITAASLQFATVDKLLLTNSLGALATLLLRWLS